MLHSVPGVELIKSNCPCSNSIFWRETTYQILFGHLVRPLGKCVRLPYCVSSWQSKKAERGEGDHIVSVCQSPTWVCCQITCQAWYKGWKISIKRPCLCKYINLYQPRHFKQMIGHDIRPQFVLMHGCMRELERMRDYFKLKSSIFAVLLCAVITYNMFYS